jgi:hypothetical protein
MYKFVVAECFRDCILSFNQKVLTGNERTCASNCTGKMMKVTNKIGELLAEKQQMASPPQPGAQ